MLTTHLVTFELDLKASPQELQQAIATELQKQGEPLRWAITAVDVERRKAQIEAVVTIEHSLLPHISTLTV
jgi:hypothetical protein